MTAAAIQDSMDCTSFRISVRKFSCVIAFSYLSLLIASSRLLCVSVDIKVLMVSPEFACGIDWFLGKIVLLWNDNLFVACAYDMLGRRRRIGGDEISLSSSYIYISS
jgi:hypothetical protein